MASKESQAKSYRTSFSWETAFKVGKANWWRLEGSDSSHCSEGVNFCPRFQHKCSVSLIEVMVENYFSSSNWDWLIFPTPTAHHFNYPFSSPANPLMLLQHFASSWCLSDALSQHSWLLLSLPCTLDCCWLVGSSAIVVPWMFPPRRCTVCGAQTCFRHVPDFLVPFSVKSKGIFFLTLLV